MVTGLAATPVAATDLLCLCLAGLQGAVKSKGPLQRGRYTYFRFEVEKGKAPYAMFASLKTQPNVERRIRQTFLQRLEPLFAAKTRTEMTDFDMAPPESAYGAWFRLENGQVRDVWKCKVQRSYGLCPRSNSVFSCVAGS